MNRSKVALVVFLGGLFLLAFVGMGCSGPSKATLKTLLHDCRESTRARARIIRETSLRCPTMAEQLHGEVGFDEAGY